MKQDEIIDKDEVLKMARQAGFVEYELDDGTTSAFDKRYEAFAKLVAEASASKEREACALLAATPVGTIAKAIRARGNPHQEVKHE